MKILYIILVVLVVLILLQAYRIYTLGKVSKQLVKDAHPYSIKVPGAVGRFLVIGDSLGVGVGSSQEDSIAGRFHKEFPAVDIYNKSQSGAKINDGLRILKSIGTTTKYDLIIIQIGANDILRLTPKARALSDLKKLLLGAHEISNQVVLITSGSVGYAPAFLEPLSSFYTWRSKSFLGGFESVAKATNTIFISLFSPKSEDPFSKNPNLYYAPDKFHPSGAGYGLWFDRIKLGLSKNK